VKSNRKERAQRKADRDARMQRMRNIVRIYQVARATYRQDPRPPWQMSLEEFLTAPVPVARVCEPTAGGRYEP
jgi:hypothetical protein